MDYSLTEEQLMFRSAIQGFLKTEWTSEAMKEAWDSKNDYPLEIYRKMGKLGWLGLTIPESYGGMGLGWIETSILYEELGRVLLNSSLLSPVILTVQAILMVSDEKQRNELLPKIAAGELVLAWACGESDVSYNLDMLNTKAVALDNQFHINGQKLFVHNMKWADHIVTIAKVADESCHFDTLGIFLVDVKSHGLSYELMDGIDGDELAEVNYKDVVVSQDAFIGKANNIKDIINIIDKMKIAYSAEMVGGAERALEIAIAYSNTRMQFGKLLGSFQAIQHKLATATILIDRSRWLSYYAAYLCMQDFNCTAEINMAYLASNEAYRITSTDGAQIYGGHGCMCSYDIGRHYKRAKAMQLELEPSYVSKERIAQTLEEKGAHYGIQIY